jgi:hypothetical protein
MIKESFDFCDLMHVAYHNLRASSCLAYSSTLKIQVTSFSETSAEFQGISWHYIPENESVIANIKF